MPATQEMHHVLIPCENALLEGDLAIPPEAQELVIFAHGSGSGRLSPRNRFVAQALQNAGLATLLLDLLTRDEEQIDNETAELRFDIRLLANRLLGCAEWHRHSVLVRDLPIGYFGASTGAAAALIAASERPNGVFAVVSRGGRPDLAREWLAEVKAPTLLIVGRLDEEVLRLNEEAARFLKAEHDLKIVLGATHLFEEEGALEEVARLAADWFQGYAPGASVASERSGRARRV
jgi:dienelactone hydrolase